METDFALLGGHTQCEVKGQKCRHRLDDVREGEDPQGENVQQSKLGFQETNIDSKLICHLNIRKLFLLAKSITIDFQTLRPYLLPDTGLPRPAAPGITAFSSSRKNIKVIEMKWRGLGG